jgi:hypothetical protein
MITSLAGLLGVITPIPGVAQAMEAVPGLAALPTSSESALKLASVGWTLHNVSFWGHAVHNRQDHRHAPLIPGIAGVIGFNAVNNLTGLTACLATLDWYFAGGTFEAEAEQLGYKRKNDPFKLTHLWKILQYRQASRTP